VSGGERKPDAKRQRARSVSAIARNLKKEMRHSLKKRAKPSGK